MTTEFPEFPKIARLNRDFVITEKIDGTNGLIEIGEDDGGAFIHAGSRTRWITPAKGDDNHGFAAWVHANSFALSTTLGPGRHYGEWYGSGIGKRHYGLTNGEKRFALFNTSRWTEDNTKGVEGLTVVPVLANGTTDLSGHVEEALRELRASGSRLAEAPFDNPEGVVIYHTAARLYFKVTLDRDEEWKGSK